MQLNRKIKLNRFIYFMLIYAQFTLHLVQFYNFYIKIFFFFLLMWVYKLVACLSSQYNMQHHQDYE